MPLSRGQWGPKPESEEEIGLGPDVQSPKPNPRPWHIGRLRPENYIPVPAQWDVYNQGRDFRPPDHERMTRSKREEEYPYQDPGPTSPEQRKIVRPDTSYWDPPPNPRNVRTPQGMSFTRKEFHNGYAPRLTGKQMSMASASRAYEIYGLEPNARTRLNTLRAEPAPLDINTYDSSAPYTPPWGVHVSHDIDGYPTSFRL